MDEVDDPVHEDFLIVPHGQVAAVGAIERAAVLHEAAHFFHLRRLHGVVFRPDHERGDVQFAQLVPHRPALEDAARHKLARPLHVLIDMLVEMAKRARQRLRPRIKTAEVLGVVHIEDELLVSRVVILPAGFIRTQLCQNFRGELSAELCVVGFVPVKVRGHVADDEPLEIVLVLQRVLHREHAAPGVAQQIEIIRAQAEGHPHLLDLLHEPLDRPQ